VLLAGQHPKIVDVAERISPNALLALKDALASAFWSKKDLLAFLVAAVDDRSLLDAYDWLGPAYKRDTVSQFVDRLAARQDLHRDRLVRLMSDVARKEDYPELAWHEDAERLIHNARASRDALRRYIVPYEAELLEAERARDRIAEQRRKSDATAATRAAVESLRERYLGLVAEPDAIKRGLAFESWLTGLFDVFDLRPCAPYRIAGEQIDGAFEFGDHHWLLEARWRKDASDRDQIGAFEQKVRRKADTTLGVFIAINGFEAGGVTYHNGRRSPIVLMDGADLMGIVDGRGVDLVQLLQYKRRHAALTGEIYLPFSVLLSRAA
jgi:hypothetical protein